MKDKKMCEDCGKRATYFITPGLGTLVFRITKNGYKICQIMYHEFTPQESGGSYLCAKCFKKSFGRFPGEIVKLMKRKK